MESVHPANSATPARPFSPDELWGGAILAVLAVGVFHAFSRGSSDPRGVEITLWQILAGLGMLAGGAALRRRFASFGKGLCAAGLTGLFAAFLVAVHGFETVPAFAGYGLMALTAAAAFAALPPRSAAVLLAIALLGASATLAGLPPVQWLVLAAGLALVRNPLGLGLLACFGLYLASQVEGLTLPPIESLWVFAGAAFFLLLTWALKALSARPAWVALPAAATVLLLSLAVTLEIGRAGLAMGCLLAIPALVWVGETLRVRALRPLIVFLIVVSGGWLVTHSALFGFPEAGAAGLPWLLYGYGLPAAAVVLAAWIAGRKGAPGLAMVLSWPAAALLFLAVTLVLRQAVEGAHGLRDGTILLLYLPAWTLLGWIVWRLRGRLRAPRPPIPAGLAGLALLLALPAAAAEAPPECRSAGTTTVCKLRVATDAGPLVVEVQGHGVTGFRLYGGWSGIWELAAEGRWAPAGRKHRLPARAEVVRLELYGTGGAPRLLGYGPRPAARPAKAPAPVFHSSSLPAATRLGPQLERTHRTSAWDVRAPGAAPGQVVRLEIPLPVYTRMAYLGQLRMAAGDREILSSATYAESPPVDVVRLAAARPRTDRSGRMSRLTVPLPQAGLPLTMLHLSAPPAPFHRQVVLSAGGEAVAVDWTCRPRPPLPCRLSLNLSQGELARVRLVPSRSLSIEFVDGDNPPLPAVDVELWRRKEEVVFPWPAGGKAQLLVEAKSTDLAFEWKESEELAVETRDRLLPAAFLEPTANLSWTRGALVAALGLAAVVLLGFIAFERRRARREKALRATAMVLALLGLAPAGFAAEEASYSRSVEVPAPGWVRVPLDEAAIRHARPTVDRIRLVGPQGQEVERRVDRSAGLFAETAAWPRLRIAGSASGFHRDAGAAVYRLQLPGAGLEPHAVFLELVPGARAGFRLYAPENGAWKLLAEGVGQPESGPWQIPVEGELAADSLRLEISGPGDPPRLLRWGVDVLLPTVLFRAETAGRYRLEYGDASLEGVLVANDGTPREDEVAWIAPGPESARPLPALPAGITAPGLPLRLDGATTAWTLRAAGVRPGEVVRAEIPEQVYDRVGTSLAGLFLTTAGRQIPYLRQELHEPGRVTGIRNMGGEVPRWMDTRRQFPGPEVNLPWTQSFLMGPANPILQVTSIGQDWTCERSPFLPCREHLDSLGYEQDPPPSGLPPVRPAGLPVPPLDVSYWRRRDVLVFVWPAGETVRLVHLDGREAPAYDLRVAGEEILARPWRPAYLGPAEAPGPGPWPRASGLAVGAGALLLALRRLLSR